MGWAPWPGGFVQGITHAVHVVKLNGAPLIVEMVGSSWGTCGVINGLQLRHVAFLEGDANHDGTVGVPDLLMVLLNWTTPGHGCDGVDPCQGDVNHDDLVDVMDLVTVISDWTG